jgi:hypothetical protein
MRRPVEPKALAAPVGGISGVVVGDFLVWGAGTLWWTPDTVPSPVTAFIMGVAVTGFSFLLPYLAPSVRAQDPA